MFLLFLMFAGVWLIIREEPWQPRPRWGGMALASSIVSDLRSMKVEALLFRADSLDEAPYWTALPEGVTSADAPGRYFAAYSDRPERYTVRDHPYRFEIISTDHGVLWWVGCDLSYEFPAVREKLEGRAERVGLINANGTPYTSEDAVVYMNVSFNMGARDQ